MTEFRIIALITFGIVSTSFLLAACADPAPPANRYCESPDVLIDRNFEGGNFHRCSLTDEGHFNVFVHPESEPPINQSPWYAFRISPKRDAMADVVIHFTDGYARYHPKVSTDGETWTPMADNVVQTAADGAAFRVLVQVSETPVWIAAQELVLPIHYDQWIRALSRHAEVTTNTLGRSVQGRPIHVAATRSRSEAIILLGRQHPPEVTGAIAMRRFVDTLLDDTELALAFRDRFSVIVIPLLNPDGVALGHWRHNVNGVDLNRDWGPFTQPETQSVARYLSATEQAGPKFRLMLDFHSTRSSLFYTQLPEDFDEPVDFATTWLSRSRARLPDVEFEHAPRGPSAQANTKNFFFSRFGIPAITYEVGDAVDRDQIAAATPVFAEEMMRLLLER